MKPKVGIISAGALGTALAQSISKNNDNILLWGRNPELINEINNEHTNSKYYPNFQLNENITVTLDLIQNVTTASKEQATGMVQINDAVNSLDQITQQNAQNASSANEIAQKTLLISNTIIEQADAKEFNGKDSIKS